MKSILFFLLIVLMSACGTPTTPNQSAETETMQDTMATETAPAATNDIVALASQTPDLSTLVQAVQAAGLVETLQGTGPFTVFAPTNAAFAALPAGTLDNLLKPENKDQLVAILTYHVVSGAVRSTDLTDGMTPATVNGANATVKLGANGSVMINDANVTAANVEASNGVVHIIDKVIMPPSKK
mgnify:CR=1 FL=1